VDKTAKASNFESQSARRWSCTAQHWVRLPGSRRAWELELRLPGGAHPLGEERQHFSELPFPFNSPSTCLW